MAARKFTADYLRQILKNHGGRFERVLEKVSVDFLAVLYLINNKQFFCGQLNIISADEGRCVAELKIAEEHTNPLGGLHGGLSATLIDSVSTWGLLTHKNAGVPSVSVDIHAT